MPSVRGHLPEMLEILRRENALPAGRLRRARRADREAARRRPAGRRGRVRAAVRPRPRHVAAPVRARARRLARPRPGDDRSRADVREGGPAAGAGRAARLPAGRARVRVHAAAARGEGVPRRDGAHPQRDLRRPADDARARTRACWARCSSSRARRRSRSRPDVEEPLDETWAEPPVFDGCSSKGQARPGAPQPIQVIRRKTQPAVAASAAAAPAASVGVQR